MATATLLVISIPFLTRTNHSTSSHGCSPSGAHHHSTLSRVSGRTPPFGGSCTSMTTLIFTTSVHLNNHLLNKDWNHPIRLHTKPGQGTTEKEKEREGGVRKKQNEKKRGWERETERNDRGGGGIKERHTMWNGVLNKYFSSSSYAWQCIQQPISFYNKQWHR